MRRSHTISAIKTKQPIVPLPPRKWEGIRYVREHVRENLRSKRRSAQKYHPPRCRLLTPSKPYFYQPLPRKFPRSIRIDRMQTNSRAIYLHLCIHIYTRARACISTIASNEVALYIYIYIYIVVMVAAARKGGIPYHRPSL